MYRSIIITSTILTRGSAGRATGVDSGGGERSTRPRSATRNRTSLNFDNNSNF